MSEIPDLLKCLGNSLKNICTEIAELERSRADHEKRLEALEDEQQVQGKTLMQIINDSFPDYDFGQKRVCELVCEEVKPGCICPWLSLFMVRKFVEVSV